MAMQNECKWCGDPITDTYFCSQECRIDWFESPSTDRLGEPKPYNYDPAHPVFRREAS